MTEKGVMDVLEKLFDMELSMDDEGQWDSLNHIEILQEFDTIFKGEVDKIPQQELATMTSPRKIIDLLKKHGLVE